MMRIGSDEDDEYSYISADEGSWLDKRTDDEEDTDEDEQVNNRKWSLAECPMLMPYQLGTYKYSSLKDGRLELLTAYRY